jgi:hypothetical protein
VPIPDGAKAANTALYMEFWQCGKVAKKPLGGGSLEVPGTAGKLTKAATMPE